MTDIFFLKDIKIKNTEVINNDGAILMPYELIDKDLDNYKRIFIVKSDKAEITKGRHAHKECYQYLICINGAIEVNCNDSINFETYLLDNPGKGLLIPPSIWAEQKYLTSNAILLVICSHNYDEYDYIRDFNEFKKYRSIN